MSARGDRGSARPRLARKVAAQATTRIEKQCPPLPGARARAERERRGDPAALRRRADGRRRSRRSWRTRPGAPLAVVRKDVDRVRRRDEKARRPGARLTVEAPRPYTLIAELTYRCPLRARTARTRSTSTRTRGALDRGVVPRVRGRRGARRHAAPPHGRRAARAEGPRGARRQGARARSLREPDHERRPAPARAPRGVRARGARRVQLSVQDVERARAATAIAGLRVLRRQDAGGRVGARARPAAHAQRRPASRQHRSRRPRSSRWPSGSARTGSSSRTCSTSAGRCRTARRSCPSQAQIARAREIAAEAKKRLEGKIEVVFVVADHYATYPRACMDGWARRFVHMVPDGTVLPCHAAMSIPGLAVRERARRAARGDLACVEGARMRFAARSG